MIVPTFVAVTFLSFLLIHLVPGDPIETRSGEHGIAPERLAELRHQFGFDQPLWRQFLHYEEQVASGDLGTSIVTQDSVWREFLQLFPATIELSVCAILFAVLVGVPLGVIAAVRRGTAFDYGLMGVSVDRRLDADLLVGADGDPAVLRHARLDAGVGPDQRCDVRRAGHRLHADRLLVFR